MNEKRSRLMRVHTDLANEIDNLFRENNQMISKVNISRNIAQVVKQQRNQGIKVDFWPLPGKTIIRKKWRMT